MRKKILLCVLLLEISCITLCQTNTLPSSGNVGIGTTDPTTRLVIQQNTDDNLISFRNSSGITKAYIGTAVVNGQMIPGTNSNDLVIRSESQKIIFSSDAGTTAHMTLGVNGNIGIGTSIPQGKLDVRGNAIFGTSKLLYLNPDFAGNGEIPSGTFIGSSGSNSLALVPSSNAGTAGAKIVLNYRSSSWFSALEVANVASGYGNLLLMKAGGNVGIGTTAPAAKLDVNGTTYSRKIFVGIPDANTLTYMGSNNLLAVNGTAVFVKAKVALYGNTWPDYVFSPSYKLIPLDSLDQFIHQYNHLPGVQSASDVEKNGIDIGKSQIVLLKKIEELTLIVIEQNKKVDAQQKLLEQQNKRITKLESEIKNKN